MFGLKASDQDHFNPLSLFTVTQKLVIPTLMKNLPELMKEKTLEVIMPQSGLPEAQDRSNSSRTASHRMIEQNKHKSCSSAEKVSIENRSQRAQN